MSQGFVYAISVAVTFGIQLTGFAVAYLLQTETFYDILGGLNYLALAVWSASGQKSDLQFHDDPRKIAMTAVFVCSRSWLLLFLAWRAHERKGDSRFDEVKDKFFSFLVYWIVQGLWVMLISMPLVFVNSSSVLKTELSPLDFIAIIGFGLGVFTEVISDIQKALWVKAGRNGGFCTVGLWAFSRHPNYFGEILQWWCAWIFAYSSSEVSGGGVVDPLWWGCIVSPLFTMHILLNIPGTGITHAEGKNLKRYYDKFPSEYSEYRSNTSVLIPFIGYRYVPSFLKRTIFLDFERYEYKPRDGKTPSVDAKKAMLSTSQTELLDNTVVPVV
uniref:Steroid 5-alpha reductase C-terminal domain-containing protein n=2 Tax=Ditylum brightwellii TaxID=49249 RepID=A0A6U3T666_9STRA|mmetsp:Transcript_34314/g.51237  ORF Transcript_34314/g.51237 Transcript_34314/m.51237 type:complete len:329 (+) Transcript_34314:57-1043(+)